MGVTAVVAPSVALGVALVFTIRGVEPYSLMLGVTYLLVGGLAWACVRVAHFRPRLAVGLTTFPFGVALLLVLGQIGKDIAAGFLLCLVELALAVLVAWAATRLAKR
jgi:hypothetical protein